MSSTYQVTDPLSSPALQSLLSFVRKKREAGAVEGFEEFKAELHEHVSAFECELVKEQLTAYDERAERVEVHGVTYRHKMRNTKEYCGVAGRFSIERSIYVPADGGKAVCPLELSAGIVERRWTPRAARLMARAVACTTPREAAEFFDELGGMRPSPSSLDRLPKRLSERWEERREEFEDELREQEIVPAEAATVAISIDGVYVPTKDGGSAKRKPTVGDERRQGPIGYREVMCGTVSLLDEQGERLETTRYGRKPEKNRPTLKAQVEAELRSIHRARPDLRVVALADGARENWEYFRGLSERMEVEFVEVVDFFHVCERVKKALDAYYGEQTADSRAYFEQLKVWLRESTDGAERVIHALDYRCRRSKGWRRRVIKRQLRYFRRYRVRMRYKELLDQDLPIGSGVVEAACKTLASERLKRSGMSWTGAGLQAVLTLRSLMQSARWAAGWALVAAEYRRVVTPVHRAG